ncbi:hypothetical protein RvY_02673-1 [Ramazzottius varieornatus]|uniref:Snake toxin/toxin-like domain-containing protein n=1 Tax=Ramazzottius varieornatus TaxID=947166 RepID=A0A1D1UV34_RAMVA|nr:hypothetical protein RvY_02673-1 [Ramazzottius varieornatus]
MDYGLLQALMKRLDSSAARLAVIFISFFLKDQVKCTASTAVVAYAPVHMDWNFTEPEPLKCYSCQSEDSDDVCMHMNNTDLVPTLLCPAHQSWCKVQHFSGNGTFRFVNRTCADRCVEGCVQATASGDFIFLEMCYSCCQDNLCNIGHNSASHFLVPNFFPLWLFGFLSLHSLELFKSREFLRFILSGAL